MGLRDFLSTEATLGSEGVHKLLCAGFGGTYEDSGMRFHKLPDWLRFSGFAGFVLRVTV